MSFLKSEGSHVLRTIESVEQTSQQIRGLINEIAEMSRSEVPGDEYFPAILKRIVDALAARWRGYLVGREDAPYA
ncbi:MAG: hypothetical protein U0930_06545 [Pirellulales bacterium]